ncbi:MAG TPA: flavin reductase family protein [Polyangiaceae bacterium]|nr:flavin reductase family protein [Polyangiaceae bacterium]
MSYNVGMGQPVSAAAFREALAHFASGVTVVAANGPSGPAGFTATGFTSVSIAPPLILVCISKEASAHEAIVGAANFGVSILDERQAWIALQFARRNVDRFEGVGLVRGATGSAPLVGEALAHIECRSYACHDGGDHTILVGEVLEATVGAGRPLLHFARRFGAFLAELPQRAVSTSASATEGSEEGRE